MSAYAVMACIVWIEGAFNETLHGLKGLFYRSLHVSWDDAPRSADFGRRTGIDADIQTSETHFPWPSTLAALALAIF